MIHKLLNTTMLSRVLTGVILIGLVFTIIAVPMNWNTTLTCTPETNPIIDLHGCAVETHRTVKLGGTWTFYPEQFLSEVGSAGLTNGQPMNVPGVWKKQNLFPHTNNNSGYGTYVVTLKVPQEWVNQSLAIRLSNVRVANRILIDGQPVAGSGVPGTSIATERAKNKPYLAVFEAHRQEVQVAIEVSNFHFIFGGIQSAPEFGKYEDIAQISKRNMVFDAIQIGILLTLFIFFVGKSYQKRFNLTYLSFAFFCLLLAVPMSFLSERLIYDVFPRFDYAAFNRILSISLELIVLTWIIFFSAIVPGIFHKWFRRIVIAVVLALIAGHLFLPLKQANLLLYIYEVVNFTLFFYTFARLVQFAFRKTRNIGYLMIISVAAISYSFGFFYNFLFQYNVYEVIPISLPIMVLTMGLYVSREQMNLTEKLNETELERLKNQIKPHFIYNALNTIMWMSKRDQAQTYHLLQNFSDYLRGNFNFSEEEKEVSLTDEMKLTNAYLELEKARFGDKISVVWRIEAADVLIPRLTLQPLVENAVRHGVCQNEHGGTITIRILDQAGEVHVEVCDDGPGFHDNKLATWASGQFSSSTTGTGIGLANVHLRLMNLYRKGITIKNNPTGGACVQFVIPRKKGH